MKTSYSDMDIQFTLDGTPIHVLNIIFERFSRAIPSHSHGSRCYELHYIPSGYGKLKADGKNYEITPNTLYVTGPHVEHAQAPQMSDPMQEYCVYVKLKADSHSHKTSSVLNRFAQTAFWIGQDTQGIHTLFRQLFWELEHQYTGYRLQVELLLSQILICMVRNYEQKKDLSSYPAPNLQADKASVIIEEYFLYEYQNLSLDTLADRLKLSTRQTQRLLKEYYGKTFQEKKAEARMSAAAILLEDRERSITSIANLLGYSSVEHFSSAFRGYYQVSPRKYRQEIATPDETNA